MDEPNDGSVTTHLAGFHDQSRLIRNFKEFAQEEPSAYAFSERIMANFFFDVQPN